MPYIGNTPTSQSFVPQVDYFNGTGSQVAFTLSRSVASVSQIAVVVNNVIQNPNSFTVLGSTLTFSEAPSAGTGNVWVQYTSLNQSTIQPGYQTVGSEQLKPDAISSKLGYVPANADTLLKVASNGYNFLHNGRFNFWQRFGTSVTLSGTAYHYPMDRWKTYVIGQVQFTMGGQGSGNPYMVWQAAQTNSFAQPRQFMDANDVYLIRSQVVTFSFYYSGNPQFVGSLIPEIGQNTITDTSTAGGWSLLDTIVTTSSTAYGTLVTTTFTVPATAVGLYLGIVPTTAQPTSGAVGISNARLNLGDTVPLHFSSGARTFHEEFSICQRFAEKSYSPYVPLGAAPLSSNSDNQGAYGFVSLNANDTYGYGWVPFKTVKRVNPTMTVYNPETGATSQSFGYSTGSSRNCYTRRQSTYGFEIWSDNWSFQDGLRVHWFADSEI